LKLFIEKGEMDGAFVVVDKNGVRTQIPVGSIACIMLEPDARASHRAAALMVRVGETGVRLYAHSPHPRG